MMMFPMKIRIWMHPYIVIEIWMMMTKKKLMMMKMMMMKKKKVNVQLVLVINIIQH